MISACSEVTCILALGHSKSICCFSSPLSPKLDAGGWWEIVVKITSLEGNSHQIISSTRPKIGAVYLLLHCAGTWYMVQTEIYEGGNQGG